MLSRIWAWWSARSDRLLSLVALGAYFGGVVARIAYGTSHHHPRHSVTKDMLRFVELASRLRDADGVQQRFDTVWPPGTAAFLAWMGNLDPTLGVAAWVQVASSCVVPLLIAHIAWLIAGRKAALIALLMASLHFGFIHYTGFFLSEAMSQLTTTVAIWASVMTCRLLDRRTGNAGSRWALILLGAATAAPWALATLFRPNALPVALFVGLALGCYWLRQRQRRKVWAMVGGLLMMTALLAPAAHRCSTLNDLGTCPVSSNFAMNVAIGQAGEVGLVKFTFTGTPGDYPHWGPPALAHHGFKGEVRVPATIYDTWGVLSWVWERVERRPWRALLRAVGNGLDLFRLEYWPDEYGRLNKRLVTVAKQVFFVAVLIPGFVGWWRSVGQVRRRRASSPLALLAAGVVAVFLLAFISMGEPRYRIPFDALWITLAAWYLARPSATPPSRRQERARRTAVVGAVGCLSGVAVLLLMAMSHPAVALGRDLEEGALPDRAVITKSANDMSKIRRAGTAWDADTFRFACLPDCPELRVQWPRLQRSQKLSLSLDHNDGYRVLFYRDGIVQGTFDVVGHRHGNGLRVVQESVPTTVGDGFDAVGVVPLYGDGRYSVGHVVAERPQLRSR